jgi:4-amino-4-deoxychorismate lyase
VNENFFETIRALDGEILNILYHQKRYESVLSSFGFSDFKNLEEYLKPPPLGLYRCRLVYGQDGIDVTYHKYEKRQIKSLKLVYDDTIEYSKKSTLREKLDNLYAMRKNCDDVLIVKNSLLCDTSIANIALQKDGVWYTPSMPLLCGTTRERLLDEGKIFTRDIRVEELSAYSKIALFNAMIDFDIISKKLKDIIC